MASYSSNVASGSSTPDGSLGFTRSRTLLFLSYRDSAIRDSPKQYNSYQDDQTEDYPDEYSNINDEYSSSKGKGKGKGKSRGGTYYDSNGNLISDNDRDPLLSNGNGNHSYPPQLDQKIDLSSLPPKWMDTSDEIDSILNALKPKIITLDRLHSKHILPGFTDRTKEEREIEAMTREITSVSLGSMESSEM